MSLDSAFISAISKPKFELYIRSPLTALILSQETTDIRRNPRNTTAEETTEK